MARWGPQVTFHSGLWSAWPCSSRARGDRAPTHPPAWVPGSRRPRPAGLGLAKETACPPVWAPPGTGRGGAQTWALQRSLPCLLGSPGRGGGPPGRASQALTLGSRRLGILGGFGQGACRFRSRSYWGPPSSLRAGRPAPGGWPLVQGLGGCLGPQGHRCPCRRPRAPSPRPRSPRPCGGKEPLSAEYGSGAETRAPLLPLGLAPAAAPWLCAGRPAPGADSTPHGALRVGPSAPLWTGSPSTQVWATQRASRGLPSWQLMETFL